MDGANVICSAFAVGIVIGSWVIFVFVRRGSAKALINSLMGLLAVPVGLVVLGFLEPDARTTSTDFPTPVKSSVENVLPELSGQDLPHMAKN